MTYQGGRSAVLSLALLHNELSGAVTKLALHEPVNGSDLARIEAHAARLLAALGVPPQAPTTRHLNTTLTLTHLHEATRFLLGECVRRSPEAALSGWTPATIYGLICDLAHAHR